MLLFKSFITCLLRLFVAVVDETQKQAWQTPSFNYVCPAFPKRTWLDGTKIEILFGKSNKKEFFEKNIIFLWLY